MRTAGSFYQDTPFSDGQIFIGTEFKNTGAAILPTLSAAGLLGYTLAASTTYNFVANLASILRTGAAMNFQEQFGTSGPPPVAGPSAVSGTSDPSGLVAQLPPILTANLPTIKGPTNGFIPKGLKINWIDAIYTVTGVAFTSADFGLTSTEFVNDTAPAVTNIVAYGANGLPTAVQAQPYVKRITPANPAFIVTPDSEIVANLNLVTPAGSTGFFYGCVFGVSFNYN